MDEPEDKSQNEDSIELLEKMDVSEASSDLRPKGEILLYGK